MLSRLNVLALLAVCASLAGCGSSNTFGGGSTNPPATGTAQLSVSPSALAFGGTVVGQTSASQVVTLSNSGTASISIGGATLSDSVDYTLMSTCPATLAAGSACAVTVAFKPQSAASLPATITFGSNATASGIAVLLSGTGTSLSTPQAVLSPASVNFGTVAAGSAAPTSTAVLSNSGTAPLALNGVTISGSGGSAFTQSSNCGSTLAAGSSCTFTLGFVPAAASTSYSATLTVTDNSGGASGSTQSVALSGAGSAPVPVAQAILSTGSLKFAATAVGTSAGTQTITLSNPGTAALTGITVTLGSPFVQTNTCGSTLAAGATCSIAVNFTPTATGSFTGTLSVQDSATGSPQTAALSGTAVAPAAMLSANSIAFPATLVNATSAASSVTLTNTGGAPLTIASITLGGSNATQFAQTTTCGTTLAAAASCTISATFTPAATSNYNATITVADNAAGSPQTIALSGSGTTSSITRTLLSFPEADLSVTPLYALINSAQKTIDMTMYELVDTTFSADLVAACNRGVKVRVILDQNLERSNNTAAYNQLNAVSNCSAAWANPAFQATHQKSFIVDSTQVAIMSLNLTSRYYSTTRDYALIENDPADIAAIQATFNTDYGSTTSYSYQPLPGDDLIWSPTTAQPDLLGIINGATRTLLVENEEMSASSIVSALQAACQRGVSVHIAMTDTGSYHANYSALEASGCGVHVYPNNNIALYIHAKAIVADYGLTTQSIYMGSINFSNASMTQNRELGLYITDAQSAQALAITIQSDYAGAPAY